MRDSSPYEITIVMTTYNRPRLLEKAIDSITSQNRDDVLIHIFDDCSTDDTPEVIKAMQSRIPYLIYCRRSSNMGSLANYDDALASVRTKYYIPLADDDWMLPGSIEILLREVQKDESLCAVIAQTLHEDENGARSAVNPDSTWNFRKYEPEELIPLWAARGHFQWSSMIFRTSSKNAVGGPDISVDSVWDVDYQMRLFLDFPVKLLKYPAAVYLLHEDQESRVVSKQHLEGIVKMVAKATSYGQSAAYSEAIKQGLSVFASKWLEKAAQRSAVKSARLPLSYAIACLWKYKLGPTSYYVFFKNLAQCKRRNLLYRVEKRFGKIRTPIVNP